MDLDDLRRAAQSDPSDIDLQIRLWQARARIEGPDAYLEPLRDRTAWGQTPHAIQDLVIDEVEGRLEGFERIGTKNWLLQSFSVEPSKGLPPNDTILVERRLEHRLPTFRHKLSRMEFNLIPGEHDIEPILIGRWPVTVRQYSILLEEKLAKNEGEEVGDPMVGLSCSAVQDRLNSHDFRLPTNDEWVYTCDAGSTDYFYWGDNFDESYIWHQENCSAMRESVLVHEKRQKWNAFGLVDMLGNIWEWTSERSSHMKVSEECRGWSFRSSQWDIEQARIPNLHAPVELYSWREVEEEWSADDIGFRAVKSLPPRRSSS
ncbi:MAG: SUMF1/EgtB/PvdO family nonheme iron enzyme [Planctomycetota bacterium]|nr:SUMF1/EgtB/PvdO family nonheme iron enzyme [Planctomycetota bacterium]